MSTNLRNDYSSMGVTSLNQLLTWGDHYKVDQDQIDTQHEAIFNICMDIAELWHARGEIEHLKELTQKLDLVLEAHFRYEERELAKLGYKKLDEHKAEHAVILRELEMIRSRLDHLPAGADRMASAFSVHNFVLGLTVGHISHSDMDYCQLTRNKARAPSEAVRSAAAVPGPIPFRPAAGPLPGDRTVAVLPAAVGGKSHSGMKSPDRFRELPVSGD